MYREIFACYPDDEAKDLVEYKVFQTGRNYERYEVLKEVIVGHVVEFPSCFMANERLTLKPSQKEFYVP
jgi:phospholipase D1/2